MKETALTKAVDRAIAIKLEAIDRFIERVIEPLEDVGNPEKLLGKKYEEWTLQDKQLLGQVYGEEPNVLSHFIFKREYPKLLEMEQEVKGG